MGALGFTGQHPIPPTPPLSALRTPNLRQQCEEPQVRFVRGVLSFLAM